MLKRDQNRRFEGVLSLSALLLVIIPSLLFVFLAKWHADTPAESLLINEATSEQFALKLGIDTDTAARIVEERSRHGAFDSTDQLAQIQLFNSDEARRLAEQSLKSQLNLGTATAAQIAAVLGIQPAFARRLVDYREEGIGIWGSSGALPPVALNDLAARLHRVPLLDSSKMTLLNSELIVRSSSSIFLKFGLSTAAMILLMFALPPLLRGKRMQITGDPYLLPMGLTLSGLGIAMLFSIKDPWRDALSYFHHFSGLLLSLAIFVLTARMPVAVRNKIKNYQYIWVFAVGILVFGLFLFGRGPEGVKLSLFGFQPVELIKLLLVFYLAAYMTDRGSMLADTSKPHAPEKKSWIPSALSRHIDTPRFQDIAPVLVMYGFALALFLIIKDLGPGTILFATFILMLSLSTGRYAYSAGGLLLLLAGSTLAYRMHLGVFPTRVDMWLHPFQNAHPNGMQLGQALWGISSGGLSGSGLGMGMPGMIPRAGSDMAFASWAEETGLIGSLLMLLMFCTLVWRGLKIALQAGTEFDRYLASGLTILLAVQTFVILCGVLGILPLTGISLPFVSFGTSSLAADWAILGLLRGISAHKSSIGQPDTVQHQQQDSALRRFSSGYAVLLLVAVGVVRLGWLQMLQSDNVAARSIYTPDADKNVRAHINPRLLALERQIERGSIYDRNGRILATSKTKEILALTPDTASARRLSSAHARLYPYGAAAAHIIGYLDPSVGGPAGIEKTYNTQLRGFDNPAELLNDYRRQRLPWYHPRRGLDVHLAMDAELQRQIVHEMMLTMSTLKDKRGKYRKDRAAFVLLDPLTGDLLAAVSTPSFDPNGLSMVQMHRFDLDPSEREEHPLVNRAMYGLYPPGSTLKTATAACALDTIPNALRFAVDCNQVSGDIHWQSGGKNYTRRHVRDDKGDPKFGRLAMPDAFRVSSNIYFANLAVDIGSHVFRNTLNQKMGFQHVPSQTDFDADLPDIGYGQGRMLASPLEMAILAASVANEGRRMQPRLALSLTDVMDASKKQDFTPTVSDQAMTAATSDTVRGLMRSVVHNGTARGVFDSVGVSVAGKTGTAQNSRGDKEPHSWFIGFAPAGAPDSATPKYAFACIVENGGYGKRVAGVICRNVLRRLF